MSKWKGTYDSTRTYHSAWGKEYPWVTKAKDGSQHAFFDESTDISADKNICVCLRFFDETVNEVVSAFLGLVPITEATGEALFKAISDLLLKCGIAIENCIGFSSDGASNMIGENNSLWSRIKVQAPHCIKMQCTCHSLALCIQKGFNKLPSNLGFMLQEVPKWFRKSTLRREMYKMLFETMNTGEERHGIPLPFLTLSTTRWLVRGKVLFNILVNWMELKAYFHCASIHGAQDVRYKARLLWEMFCDDLNALFQSNNASPSSLLLELDIHYKSLHNIIYSEQGTLLPLNKTDFGAKFSMECNRLLSSKNMASRLESIQQRCQEMLVELVSQVKMRLPENRGLFDKLSKLSPHNVLTQLNRPKFNELPFPHLQESLELCEEQYRKILYHPWNNEEVFSSGIPEDPVNFWASIKKYEEGGRKPYEALARYALAALTTPVSNALVERIFSHVNAVKTKVRNQMKHKMLEAILRIRTTLIMSGKCCKDLIITESMLEEFNVGMYEHTRSQDCQSSKDDGLNALYE
ncbi:zinc finger BED domain-containing protein 5-like [Penaeus japonicus]|uniref:zinc finger BED domain-containing protein 5-like n=1 Tax=Penaeus japonicus TaxID=27405 RepID=UPI001C717AB6|nr:zinc finger BED domain-containing protein 5-like [Penaeus japonicus]